MDDKSLFHCLIDWTAAVIIYLLVDSIDPFAVFFA